MYFGNVITVFKICIILITRRMLIIIYKLTICNVFPDKPVRFVRLSLPVK